VPRGLTVRDQVSLFALLVFARPVTNRDLRESAGMEMTAETVRNANPKNGARIAVKKRGAVNTYKLTPAGKSWCESALAAGRPDKAKFPAGVLFAVLESIGLYLARSDVKLNEFFKPDIENWIRSAYRELTVRRGSGSWIRLADLRPWLDDIPQDTVDKALDRMIEQPDVQLMAQLNQRRLTEQDHDAAVVIGGEPRHLLRIGPA
jgi:hypothetical protein